MSRSVVAAPVVALALAGCLGAPLENPFESTLQGTWSACVSDGVADTSERLTFSGDALEWTVSTHATSDGSCGGAETMTSHVLASFTIGEFVNATLRGAPVVARGLDVTDARRTFYTTAFVNESASPRTLFLGRADVASGRDMTSGAKRPVLLDATPLTQQ